MNRVAKAAARLNNQTSDLELMRLDDVIRKYPEGITLTWMDLRTSEDGNEYISYTFAEEPGKYSSGSGDFLRLWEFTLEEFGGSITDMQLYMAGNPVRVKVWKTKTKSKRTYTKVKIMEADDDKDTIDLRAETAPHEETDRTDANATGG